MKMLSKASIALLLVAAAHSVNAEPELPEQVIAAKSNLLQESLHDAIDGIMSRSLGKYQASDGLNISGNRGVVSVEEVITVEPIMASNWSALSKDELFSKKNNLLFREGDGSWKIVFQSWN